MQPSPIPGRVRVSGKFLRLGAEKFFIRGLSYGPFAPNSAGEHLPEREQVDRDFVHIRDLGGNCIRVYYPPPVWLLDAALDHDLRVFIDVPWEKHRCFFEDWGARERARASVRATARELGGHPGVLALSVVNEIPVDVARFSGRRRIERFVDELIDIAKEEAPDCPVTFVNFPTTEYLEPKRCDFVCFNVYLHDDRQLSVYFDRLQHLAGNRPLVLGEYGIDTLRGSELDQAAALQRHVQCVARQGLAGSFVFSYTDDWFTGGHPIEDWAFGITRRDRSEKLAARALTKLWSQFPELPDEQDQPKVSVVICSYNGGATLRECLESLMRLDYADYEVLLIDDGSTDDTAEIARDYPQVIYHYQPNMGLSAARNVGAQLATGDIVAYTDSDCVADEHWLLYLVRAMQHQQVEAIGGPNITPDDDGWVARCVAASPGNPSHVMLDDRRAEHVPGCNMAFRREALLNLGGFDAQFRQAGDDVDLCWRMLDANLGIGYAPGAMVWHHRRATVGAFARQQRGYGRSEAMVHFKHPQRCGAFGRSTWHGIIYGHGAIGLPLLPDIVYHGQFGMGLFQTIYRHNHYGYWAILVSLEWHLAALLLLLLALLVPPLAGLAAGMWLATLTLAARYAWRADLPRGAPCWCRPLVGGLYLLQPVWRGWYRTTHVLLHKRLPVMCIEPDEPALRLPVVKTISRTTRDLYWESDQRLGREELLRQLVRQARVLGWYGDYDNAWSHWDVKLAGDRWCDITIHTATEELGWERRFTRARFEVRTTRFARVMGGTSLVWTAAALAAGSTWATGFALLACLVVVGKLMRSRRRCLRSVTRLVARAGRLAGLSPVGPDGVRIPLQSPPDAEPSPAPPLARTEDIPESATAS